MYIRNIDNEPGERVPFNEEGTKVTFGVEENSYTVDVASLQQDSQVIFDVKQEDDGTLGITGHWYAATLTIPPKRYEMVEGDMVTISEEGEEERAMVPQALPLDMGAVEVALYRLGKPLLPPEPSTEFMGAFEEQ